MANTYYKLLSQKIEDTRRNDIINDIQNTLRKSHKNIQYNLYDFLAQKGRNTLNQDLEINNLLKYYLYNQILKDCNNINIENKSLSSLDTTNSNIKKSVKENKFYQVKNTLNRTESIIEVRNDGSYITEENILNSKYKLKKVYTLDNILESIQLLYCNDIVIEDKFQVIKLLGLKKEFVEKYKYNGYSGDSLNLLVCIMNKLCNRKESGYYMDNTYNLYKWDEQNKIFCAIQKQNFFSPLLTDYEFIDNIVVRKEYTGK